jgi:hypothetical protein
MVAFPGSFGADAINGEAFKMPEDARLGSGYVIFFVSTLASFILELLCHKLSSRVPILNQRVSWWVRLGL